MQPSGFYRQLVLDNGLEIIVRDMSRVYFGDYHRVRLAITCRPIDMNMRYGALASTDPVPEFHRVVEKMGVPSAEVEMVRESLVRDFLNNSLQYLSATDFPAKLAASAARKPKAVKRLFLESNE